MKKNGQGTDRELWAAFQRGDEEAYMGLYVQYVHHLYEYGMFRYRDKAFVEDVIHDFYLHLWRSRERLSEVSAIFPYLLKAFRRFLYASAKKQSQDVNLSDTMVVTGAGGSTEHPADTAQVRDKRFHAVQRALPQLHDKQQEIIHFKFYEGLSYAEIGDIMGLDAKAVYNLMFQALKQLRKYMGLLWFGIFMAP
ncbi:RNA polymerase sigma factor [Sinomicrobium oceani]|uniref:RNA polymerase sigma factor n=1 Tax=Sinomicrobium oceani TaxID=1150368 RepID=UPI00227ABC62|nr:sigma-70 family RNA polymerase sigma factor [Sinomicrobium oceani]